MMERIKNALRIFLNKLINIFSTEAKEVINEELGGGLLGIGESKDDYILGYDTINHAKRSLAKKKDLSRELIYEYNQGAQWETRNWCTIYSAITELSFLMDRKFSLCEIKEIGHKMIKDGKLDPDKGAYLHDAIDAVRNYWNANNEGNEIVSYQIDYTDTGLIKVLDRYIPRPTQLGYRTSAELGKEARTAPYIVKGTTYKKVGGHAVSRWKGEIVNNYKKTPTTHNRFQFAQVQELITNGVVFSKGYMFLKKN